MSLPKEIRSQFPMLCQKVEGCPYIYLDTAATALKPKIVIDALSCFYSEQYGTVHRAIYHFAAQATEAYEGARQKAQKFLRAKSPDEVIFTKGTTEAINLVASSFGESFVRQGDEILITEMEHHSNIVPWQLLCERKQAKLIVAPVDDQGVLLLEELQRLLTPRTKLFSLAHISNVTGVLNPIPEIVRLAKAQGTKVFLDGAQSAPHMPIDVEALGVDFFAFSGHKAFGPTGIGVLWGRRELLEAMAPYQSGSDMIDEVAFSGSTFQPIPLKFEAGTPPIAEAIALGAALDWIEAVGREQIAAWEQELVLHAMQKIRQISEIEVLGPPKRAGALISFVAKGIHALDLGTLLDLKGVALRTGHLCAQPLLKRLGYTSVARVSFGPYNTFEEVDLFVAHLKEVLNNLSP